MILLTRDNDNKIILLIEFDGRQHYDINTKYYSEKNNTKMTGKKSMVSK
nr:MAG TPA: hypothetical protein [Caudoviricetes sp.]